MYIVNVLYNDTIYPLHVPGTDDLFLIDPELTLETGVSGSFIFGIPPTHPHYDKIHPLTSEFYVYQDGEELFRGRYAGSEEDFYRIGKIKCESDLSYLLDSIQRPYEHKGSIIDFLKGRLAVHNSGVENRKQFTLGKVNVVDSNNYISRSSSGLSDTLTCLREKLVNTHGGYLRTRYEENTRYLDYVTDYGGINSQVIRFGENLLDLSKYIDASSIITALVPIGANLEITNQDGTVTCRKVDITSVNDGIDYIYDQNAVDKYGWITGVHEWEDVTLPKNLLKKAKDYLQERIHLPVTMELTAVDLSLAGTDVQRLKVGYWTKVESSPHGITGTYLLTKRTFHLTAPEKDTILLGGSLPSLSVNSAKSRADMSLKLQKTEEKISKEIESRVENATQLITGGLGGYILIGRAEDGHPEEILIMDAPTKEAATNVIRLNKNGIGFSTSGYNGIYRNAWTIDGNLVADFITAGTMLADRIRGGTLEVGGSGLGRDGRIILMDSEDNVLCVLDENGVDVRRGTIRGTSIEGSTLVLGGQGNVQGRLTVNQETGEVVCRMDADGLYAIRGNIGGWDITDEMLSSGTGMIASYAGDSYADRATMNDASFKIWKREGDSEKTLCYMGRGGFDNRGSKDSGLFYIRGGSQVEIDGSTGKINTGGMIQSYGDIISTGGDVSAKNIDDMLTRIEALEAKVK